MSTAQDPFSLVYAELWATVLSHPRSSLIRPGNRIRFDG